MKISVYKGSNFSRFKIYYVRYLKCLFIDIGNTTIVFGNNDLDRY